MKPILRFVTIALLSFALAVLASGCDDVVADATFREWCGDVLCAWKLDTGAIRKAPTWHKDDHGVELVSTPTAISQVVDKTPRCLAFTTVADVDPSAQVSIGIDFNNDGSIDVEQPIAAVAFREVKTEVTAPVAYSGLRFVITKKGVGKAVLAQIRVQSKDECGAAPLELKDQALGSLCRIGGNEECASGVCCEGICAECCKERREGFDLAPDGGVVTPPFIACPGSESCEKRDVKNSRFIIAVVPLQCDPGRMNRPAGDECLADDDCASGECVGATSEARRSTPAFGDAGPPCKDGFPDAGECTTFTRVRGGRCR